MTEEKHIEFDHECSTCGGTGLFQGMAERDGFAVQCNRCKGTGKYHFKYTYREFQGRKKKEGVLQVLQFNPGICVGTIGRDGAYPIDYFGGMSLQDWESGKEFTPGTEMRTSTCPAWWYQLADYSKKPDWKECIGCGSFSGCKNFSTKEKCWERWDQENKTGAVREVKN